MFRLSVPVGDFRVARPKYRSALVSTLEVRQKEGSAKADQKCQQDKWTDSYL